MRVLSFLAVLALGASACGVGTSTAPGVGEATVQDAVAATVLLTTDPAANNDFFNEITEDGSGELSPEVRNLRSTLRRTVGGPDGRWYLDIVFQSSTGPDDRLAFAERIADMGLDEPIWLGPDDVRPYCREEPCERVRDEGTFDG